MENMKRKEHEKRGTERMKLFHVQKGKALHLCKDTIREVKFLTWKKDLSWNGTIVELADYVSLRLLS